MNHVLAQLSDELAGRYVLGHELGSGGMATVYLADDLKHERRVAVKVLRPEIGAMLGAERFLHEIRITAHLQHPHILPLFDSGAVDGLLWYVMPFVAGESLRDRLAREGRLSVDAALMFASQVASALDYAHRHGVIHRDIKPANILLVEDQALVADFGIALGVRESASTRLTGTGLSLGTPQYMSPEQASGSPDVDARTDVYAVGCVLFEMLTGRTPFTGVSTQEVVAKVLTESTPKVSTLRPECPAVLDGLLARALARQPAQRYQTAGELGSALRGVLGGTASFPSAAAARRRRRGAVLVALTALMMLAGWWLFGPRPPVIPVVGQTTRLTFAPGAELDPALSPDGRMIAFAAGPVGRMRIFVRQVDEGRAVALTDELGGNHRAPHWSPDGSRIAFVASGGDVPFAIYVLPALGGTMRRVVEAPSGSDFYDFAWSHDGTRLVYAVDSVVQVRGIDGGEPAPVATTIGAHSFAWSPDDRYVAFVDGNPTFALGTAALGNAAPSLIRIVPAEGGSTVQVTAAAALNVAPAWAPDGQGLFFISNRDGTRDIWYQPLNGSRLRGTPVRLTTGLQAHSLDLSRDGRRLLYSVLKLEANVWRVAIPPAGSPPATPVSASQITTGSQAVEGLGLSPDGAWLAYDSDLSGNQEVYRIPVQGGPPERLTDNPADDFMPSWSPDGSRIAFYSFRTGNRDLFVMDADGGSPEQVTSDSSHDRVPDWSPDGRTLVYYSDRTGRAELFLIGRDSAGRGWSSPRQLTFDGGGNPRWSPDGRLIAFRKGYSVHVIRPDGGAERALVPEAAGPGRPMPHWMEWAPDSRTLYFKTLDPDGRSTVFAVPVAGGTAWPVLVFPDPARQSPRTEFATDGRSLYFTLGSHEADIWSLQLRSP